MKRFLKSTQIVDWKSPEVHGLAVQLARDRADNLSIIRACFEWVRDRVPHTRITTSIQ